MKAKSIIQQILSWMLVVAIIPLLLLTAFYLYSYDTHYKKQVYTHLNHIADYKTIQINNYISERIKEAQFAAQLPSTKDTLNMLIPKFKQRKGNESKYKELENENSESLLKLLELGFSDVLLLSNEADIVLSLTNTHDLYKNLKHAPYSTSDLAKSVNNALSLNEPYLSNFSYYSPTKALVAFIAVAVLEKEQVIGIIAFQLDNKQLQAVVADRTGLGVSGETHIAASYNRLPFFMKQAEQPEPVNYGLPMQQAFKGVSGSYIAHDRQGVEVLAISRYLPYLHAGLVIKIDSEEVLKELNNFWLVSLISIFFVLFLVIFFAIYLSRTIARPISILTDLTSQITQGENKQQLQLEGTRETQQLATAFNLMMQKVEHEKILLESRVQQRTNDLSQKEQYLSLTLNSIGDAVISTDSKGIISKMNLIAEQLTGWKFSVAKGKHIKEVFNIVDPKTEKPMINIVEQVLLSGKIAHQKKNTLLISKHGRKYHITDSVAPIRSKKHITLGVVLVFKDETENVCLRESEQILAENIRQSEQRLRLYREHSPVASIEWGLNGKIVNWNKAAEAIFGYSFSEVQDIDFIDLIFPGVNKLQITDIWHQLISVTNSEDNVSKNLTKDGKVIYCEWYNSPLKDNNGSIIGAASLVLDITERQQMGKVLQTLAESGGHGKENIFQIIVRQLALSQGVRHALIAIIDPAVQSLVNTLAAWENGHFIENFTYSLTGTPCQEVFVQGSSLYVDKVQELFPEDQLLVKIGAVSYLGELLKSIDGKSIGFIALLDDKPMQQQISSNKLLKSLTVRAAAELERKLAEEKLQFAARIFDNTQEGITLTDAQGVIVDVNPGFCRITGYKREEVIGQNPRILSSGKQSKNFYRRMWKSLIETGHWQGEMWNTKKNGENFAQLITISSLLDDDNNIVNYVGLFTDITTAKKQQNTLELMAHYDTLTHLPNRTLFTDRFSQAVAHSKRKKSLLAICFIDLDEFKPVNDTFGHGVGDQVLVQVAHRIRECIREQDTASRIGGDEFLILLGDLYSVKQCKQAIERIHQAIATPYKINGQSVVIAASSGITIYPFDDADLDTLIRHADSAMYKAKLAGRNQYHIFDTTHEQSIIKRHAQLNEIETAFNRNEFCLYFQPKINMLTNNVFGVEALIRWHHSEKGIIPPSNFLSVLEGSELEISIGNWVIDEALKQLNIWRQEGLNLQMSVNISARHLQWQGFIKQVATLQARYPAIAANFLQLEILESSVINDIIQFSGIIEECRTSLGVSIALDDFGVGYSSLTHLRHIPSNAIKIDQSFVHGMLEDTSDSAIVEGIIGLAKAFDRDVIAEGVKTKAHGLMLIKLGCVLGQGYGIARPMPAKDFAKWHKAQHFSDGWIK